MRKLYKSSMLVGVLALVAVVNVNAQSLLPDFLDELMTNWSGTSATEKIVGFVRLALTLAFGIVVLAAVLFSILSAIKYIQSQGDAGKVEEANKAIKAIFQGVVAMFVGIIGVVIVFFIFDVVLPDPSLPPICVKSPESQACRTCSEGRDVAGTSNICIFDSTGAQTNVCESKTNCETSDDITVFNN